MSEIAATRTLDEQRAEYIRNRFLAMPLAGIVVWGIIGISGAIFPLHITVWVIFIATGSVAYLGMLISKFTGEDFLDKSRPKNTFDKLFFYTIYVSFLVYAIAIPFLLIEHSSLPMTVGILTGLMWVPFSWTIQHWVGLFHGTSRTALIVAAWYIFPEHRFTLIPAIIIAVYIATILILENRWRNLQSA